MRRSRLLLAPLLLAAALAGAPAGAADPCTRVQDRAVDTTGLGAVDGRIRVIVPSGYCATGATTAYPVLLLLHGVGDTWQTWTQNTDLVDLSADDDVIIVMPDGGKTPEAGWYSDWADGSRKYETLHIDRVLGYVDAHYRTLGAGHRAVAGLSMGGFGAMSYAARHDGLFQAAASFSGMLDTMHGWPVNGFGYALARSQFGTPDERVWGHHVTDADEWRAHNPASRAADLDDVELFVTTGTGTPGGFAGDAPTNPGAYAVEAYILQLNASFLAHLEAAGVGHSTWIYPGGYHGWPYWEAAINWALPRLVAAVD